MNEPALDTSIAIKEIDGEQRTEFMNSQLTGPQFLWFETTLFSLARRMLSNYDGGFWCFYELSFNGQTAFFWALRDNIETLTVSNPVNCCEKQLPPHSAGVCLSIMALNTVITATESELLYDKYLLLMDYATTLPEWPSIAALLD